MIVTLDILIKCFIQFGDGVVLLITASCTPRQCQRTRAVTILQVISNDSHLVGGEIHVKMPKAFNHLAPPWIEPHDEFRGTNFL